MYAKTQNFIEHPVCIRLVRLIGPTLLRKCILRLKKNYFLRCMGLHLHSLPFEDDIFFADLVNHFDNFELLKNATKWSALYWVVFLYSTIFKIKFCWNMAHGTGHNTVELDYALRIMKLEPNLKLVLIRRASPFHVGTINLFGHRFHKAPLNDIIFELIAPCIIALPASYRLDVGLGRGKMERHKTKAEKNKFLIISKQQNIDQYGKYFSIRQSTSDYRPLISELKTNLKLQQRGLMNKLNLKKSEKLALVHIKENIINATAAPTDPENYIPAINFLKKLDFTIIHVGREAYPSCFKKAGVINYSETPYANYENDFILFSMADLCIISSSGISWFPDCMGVKYLYLDSWHLPMQQPSEFCISVPSRVYKASDKKFLSAKQQSKVYLEMADEAGEKFPQNEFHVRNASSQEIVEALRELLDHEPLFEANNPLAPAEHQPYVKSKISKNFLSHNSGFLK